MKPIVKMTSDEISAITGKRHFQVMCDIGKFLCSNGVNPFRYEETRKVGTNTGDYYDVDCEIDPDFNESYYDLPLDIALGLLREYELNPGDYPKMERLKLK